MKSWQEVQLLTFFQLRFCFNLYGIVQLVEGAMAPFDALSSRHLVVITLSFIVWKAILGLVAYNSPGIGYDTSSSLLERLRDPRALTETPSTLQNSITKLIRWDAVYFTQIAARNYVFEQEWAFSFAFSRITSIISRGKSTLPRM